MSDAREEGTPVRGIVLGHGDMARGLVQAVERIAGPQHDGLRPLSNEGLTPESLREAVDELAGEEAAVVFTDLHAGSCAMTARLSCRGRGDRAVVCGVNLPMLLDFVFHREMPVHELVERLGVKGREGIKILRAPE